MIRAQKLPANILDLLPAALDYLETHPKIIFAYLFGGLAKHRPFPLSDVDIAVYLKRGSHLAECKLDILGRLMDILHTDEIDIYESLIMRKSFDFSFRELNHLRRRYMHG